jgi:phage N-6-adenine-methyltransferase
MAANRNVDYGTPQWLFDQLDAEFHFTIDACALPHNAKCNRYWSPEQDGLRQGWAGETPFWNPPFDDCGAWARKAYNESLRGVTSVGLVPTRRQDYWFRLGTENAQMRLIQGGILLFAGGGDQAGRLARQDCTVFVFGPTFKGGTIGPFLVPPYKPNDQPRVKPTGIRQYTAALNKPEGTKVLRTYAELIPFFDAFAQNYIHLLIVLSTPGLSKSTLIRSRLPANTCLVKSTSSAFKTYARLHESKNAPVAIEDADQLLRNPDFIELLKQLCEHEGIKLLFWEKDSARLRKLDIPNQFETTSRVLLTANDFGNLRRNLAAVEDRGIIVSFEPFAAEVHAQVAREGWFRDLEIFDFVGAHLHLNLKPTMRYYTRALEVKTADLDWEDWLLTQWLSDEDLVKVAALLSDPALPSTRAKAQAFEDRGFGSRATFFRKARILRAR